MKTSPQKLSPNSPMTTEQSQSHFVPSSGPGAEGKDTKHDAPVSTSAKPDASAPNDKSERRQLETPNGGPAQTSAQQKPLSEDWPNQFDIAGIECLDGGVPYGRTSAIPDLLVDYYSGKRLLIQKNLGPRGSAKRLAFVNSMADQNLATWNTYALLDELIALARPCRTPILCIRTALAVLESVNPRGPGYESVHEAFRRYGVRIKGGPGGIMDGYRELSNALITKIGEAGLTKVFNLEMNLVRANHAMRKTGIALERTLVLDSMSKLRKRRSILAEMSWKWLGRKGKFASIEEVESAVASAGTDATRASRVAAGQVEHPIAQMWKSYRRDQEYLADLEFYMNETAGDRLDPIWDPLGSDIGQYSCTWPSFPAQAGEPDVWQYCRPGPGDVFVRCDFTAAALGPLVFLAGEERLTELFSSGENFYQVTAAGLFRKRLQKVTPQDVLAAKLVALTVAEGGGSTTIAQFFGPLKKLDLPFDFAKFLVNRFVLRLHPELSPVCARLTSKAATATEVRTLAMGRRLLLPTGPEWQAHRARYLHRVTTMGTVEDGVKLAMLALSRQLPKGAYLVARTPEEVVVEARQDLAEQVKAMVEEVVSANVSAMMPGVGFKAVANVSATIRP
jgi:hypothetical protein